MPDAEDITETIAQSAADGIDSVTIADQTTKIMSVDDQIKAATHVAAQSSSPKSFGLRFSKLVPPECG